MSKATDRPIKLVFGCKVWPGQWPLPLTSVVFGVDRDPRSSRPLWVVEDVVEGDGTWDFFKGVSGWARPQDWSWNSFRSMTSDMVYTVASAVDRVARAGGWQTPLVILVDNMCWWSDRTDPLYGMLTEQVEIAHPGITRVDIRTDRWDDPDRLAVMRELLFAEGGTNTKPLR